MFTIDLDSKTIVHNCGLRYCLNGLAIVISPHQDDESIGMAGAVSLLLKKGFTVYFVFTTIESTEQALLRKLEAKKAIKEFGGNVNNIIFLDLVDGMLKLHTLDFSKTVGHLKTTIQKIELKNKVIIVEENGKEILIDNKHTLILTTSRHDAHRDHEETFNMIKNGTRKKIIMEFPVVNHMSSAFEPNCYIEISDEIYEIKKNALSKYVGEEIKGRIMWEDIEQFMLDNGKLINATRAESCFISWYGKLIPSQKNS